MTQQGENILLGGQGMELVIAVIVIILIPTTIIAWISSLKNEVESLRSRNTFLSESLTETKTELDSLKVNFAQTMQEKDADLEKKTRDYNAYLGQKNREISALTDKITAFSSENDTLRKSLSEAPLGFPSLLEVISLYDSRHDERLAYWLETKSHPAYTAAQTVRTETQKRRDAELEARRTKLLLDYYFSISPDAQEELEADKEQASS